MTNDNHDTAIFIGMLADCPTPLLIAELEKRGYTVTDGQLPFVWESDDEDEGEVLSA
jgi:hypothetical protein